MTQSVSPIGALELVEAPHLSKEERRQQLMAPECPYPDRETARSLVSAVSAGALVVGLCDVAYLIKPCL